MYCLTEFCCICFCNKQPVKHLSDTNNDNITYYFKLTSCVPEMCFNEINEQRLVCNKCCETINTVYKFRQTCLRSKTIITDYISLLPTASDVSGAANKYFKDSKQYQNENNVEHAPGQINLLTNVEKVDNGTENFETKSEYNADSFKLIDKGSNYFKMQHIKTENVDRCYNSLKNQDDINIIANNSVLTVSGIKKESEKQVIEECSTANFENILVNEDTKYVEECYENSLMNLEEIKIDIVDHDIALFDPDLNGEINRQSKNENFKKFAKNKYSDMTALDPNFCYATMEEMPKNSVSNINSNLPEQRIANRKNEDKSHECSICKATFKQTHDLNFHMRIHTSKKTYDCSVCNKKFHLAEELKGHMTFHTDETPYECSVCKKKFKRSGDLKPHMRIHTGEKPYECSVCKRKFNRAHNLKIHIRIHTGKKPYECNVCKKKFKQTSELKIHTLVHTGENPFECSVCEKKFKRASQLNIHMRIHTGDVPYECSECKKKFKQARELKIHMRIHTGEKPYECSICKKNFNQPHTLKRHMKTHNSD